MAHRQKILAKMNASGEDAQLELIDRELAQMGSTAQDAAMKVLAQLVTNEATKQPRLISQIIETLIKEKKLSLKEVTYCIGRLRELRIIRYLEER